MKLESYRRIYFVATGLVLAAAASAVGVDAQPLASPARVLIATSVSGRFIAVGYDSLENGQYLRWAEEMADRMERMSGLPLPGSRQPPLEFRLADGRRPAPGVASRCAVEGGRLVRVLDVNAHVPIDYEDLLDQFCRLVLIGSAAERRQKAGLPAAEIAVPQWLSTGLAQNLDPACRVRNRKLISGWTPKDDVPALSAVLRWDDVPGGWYRARAVCGMVWAWAGNRKDSPGAYGRIVDRLAQGEPISPEWLAAQVAGTAAVSEMEGSWREWLRRQDRMVQDMGALSSALLDALKTETELSEADMGGFPPALKRPKYTPAELIAKRRASGAVKLAAEEKAQKLRALVIGKAP